MAKAKDELTTLKFLERTKNGDYAEIIPVPCECERIQDVQFLTYDEEFFTYSYN
jgi:hypothetical protein